MKKMTLIIGAMLLVSGASGAYGYFFIYQAEDSDNVEIQQEQGSFENWDWEHLKQVFATHLMIDASFQKIKENYVMKHYQN